MRMKTYVGGFLSGCAVMALAAMTFSPQDPGDMEKAWQEAMEKYMSPAAEHEMLAKRAGNWKAEIKMWQSPDMPPETTSGDSTFEMAMDGRYLVQHFTGNFNGMPFEGAGVTGYDRMKKQYQAVWIDNMSTGIAWSEGKQEGDKCVYKGDMPDPMQGKYVPVRSVETMPDDNTLIMTMYMPGPDGKDFKSMEITYTRVPK